MCKTNEMMAQNNNNNNIQIANSKCINDRTKNLISTLTIEILQFVIASQIEWC